MAKRGRTSGGSVTGGTGDIKPQTFSMMTSEAGAVDDYVVNSFNLPVPKMFQKNKTTIIEVLKAEFLLNPQNFVDATATEFCFLPVGNIGRQSGDATALNLLVEDATDPRVLAYAIINRRQLTSGSTVLAYPIVMDLTDQNGNGVLVATDKLFLTGGGIGNGNVGNYICRIFYRYVSVPISEYVGIVQSQVG